MLRKNKKCFPNRGTTWDKPQALPRFWVVARSNYLLADSTDYNAGGKTTNIPLFKAVSILKSEKQ